MLPEQLLFELGIPLALIWWEGHTCTNILHDTGIASIVNWSSRFTHGKPLSAVHYAITMLSIMLTSPLQKLSSDFILPFSVVVTVGFAIVF
jgi:hypothetical protein